MNAAAQEHCQAQGAVRVEEAEFVRLLGYPRGHSPEARSRELMEAARAWYGENGRPWIYRRTVEAKAGPDELRLGGVHFESPALREHFQSAGAGRAVLFAVSAGAAAERRAQVLWEEGKPDEYFFLQTYAAAVVERLVADTNGVVCAEAENEGFIAIPHYSPGYSGWDVAEQNKLFRLIEGGMAAAWPEAIEVLESGMIRPTKSLLGVIGLAGRTPERMNSVRLVPCQACGFEPCRFRRAAYRHGAATVASERRPYPHAATYTLSTKVLQKWAKERLRVEARGDGTLRAVFRYDGKTCSNLGQPLAFDYVVTLSGRSEGYRLLESDCRPAPGDEGHRKMCGYLSDGDALISAIAADRPLIGQPLGQVLAWSRPAAPSGCYCTAETRAHKWGLVLEVLHYALSQSLS